MNLTEFRANKRNVKAAYDLLHSPTGQLMLETLKVSNPLFFQSRNLPFGGNVTTQDHSRLLGMIEGYHLAVDYLVSMSVLPPTPPSEIAATFEPLILNKK